MIRFEAVDLSVAGQPLLGDIHWHLTPGTRVGLVGRNGAGKTTLLRAMMGEITADAGALHRRKSATIAWLPQHAVSGATTSVWDEVRTGMIRLNALRAEFEAAEEAVAGHREGAIARLDRATEAYRAAGGFKEDATIGGVLSGLGFAASDWERPCNTFSGGWQMRIALARLLLSEPDVALLDEPTNHLDLHARSWLADHLVSRAGASVIVSHDRYLLDTVAQRIIEVRKGRVTEWVGNFSAFLVQREQARATQGATHAKQQKEIAKLERFVERFGAKATKAVQAKSKQKAIDRIDRVEAPDADRRSARLRLPEPPDCGFDVIHLLDADIGWPDAPPLLRGVELHLERGMRLAVLGPNGCGKSTLLKVLSGKLPPQKGRRRRDDRARIGVFNQDLAADLPGELTPLQHVQSLVPLESTQRVRTVLGALGLSGDDALRPIASLSGGERARVALAALTIRPHNALLLDEPSNHLDIQTVEVLADALAGWPGALLLVSHDRYLVERVASHVAHLEEGAIAIHEGVRADDFQPAVLRREVEAKDSGAADDWAERKRKRGERVRMQKRYDAIHPEIEAAEAALAVLDEQLFAEAANHQRALELGAQRQVAQGRVDALFEEWEALEEALAEDPE